MTPDCELLRQYAEHGDEAAFAEVVRRHVDWVYSVALRLAGGDAHLAQDITQSVFTDCARHAEKLSRYDAPGGWLHTAARFAAAKAVDREQRRRAREQEAYAMQNETRSPEICWEQLRPVLDEAIGRLGERDRAVVVMRFFEGKSHREIGELAGLSEDSARKRVERAVEKLRAQFLKRGVGVTAALLGEAINADSIQAAPAGLSESISRTALANAAKASGIASLLLKPFLLMTTTTKVIVAVGTVLILAGAYNYATRLSDQAGDASAQPPVSQPVASVSPGLAAPKVAEVAAPRQPAAAVSNAAMKSTTPLAANPPPAVSDTGSTAPQVDPQMRDALAMMAPMKALYGDIYQSLMEAKDPETALRKFDTLQPQIDALRAKIVGTPLEQMAGPALDQLQSARVALEQGDIAKARKIIQSLNKIGQNVQTKIETTAGLTIDQATVVPASTSPKSTN